MRPPPPPSKFTLLHAPQERKDIEEEMELTGT